nr:ribonuclease H-like domain-containing protein [Tanacetum cinerariifolium]
MVTIGGEDVDWTGHAEDDTEDYALRAFNSRNSGSGTEVTSCSKVCEESYGNYMPPKFDFGIDESKFTYGPKQYKINESDAKTSNSASCDSNSSVQTLESVPKPIANEPKVIICMRIVRNRYALSFNVNCKPIRVYARSIKGTLRQSLSPQVVSAAKFLILNPNEFDIWKMRIEQYFVMTDYSLWEIILNGDSPIPTRVTDGEQRLARKNEL